MPEHGKSILNPSATSPSSPNEFGARSRATAPVPSSVDMVAALRALPFGGVDETARNLDVSPQIQATISPVVNAFRWAAVMYGMIFGAAAAFKGSYSVVATLSVCLFLTCWRTMIPIRLGSRVRLDRVVALTDVLILGLAVGASGGPVSPFVFCVMAGIAVAAFGWGYLDGALAFVIGWAAMIVGHAIHPAGETVTLDRAVGLLLGSMVLVALGSAFLRTRLIEAEERRRRLAGQVDTLAETNDLLTMLNAVARTLPTSLNQREAIDAARQQVIDTFRSNVICLLEYDEAHDEWIPKLTEGCAVKPTSSVDELPVHLRQAMDSREPWLVPDLTAGSLPGISPTSGSGLYTKLESRGRVVGVLGIEHATPGQYRDRDRRLLLGMADVVALTLDNARWFGRLRSLGAEGERARIARDLHDRLGQWLTYISFELERFISTDGSGFVQLTQLYADVQTALGELRETLRQLRSGITEDRPLSMVGKELVDRYAGRTGLEVAFRVTNPTEKMPVPVENELLRILQEALNNVDKHAKASRVDVTWAVDAGTASLVIADNGRGFDAAKGVRDSAYGLVGMRERVDVIGGRIAIESAVQQGTTVSVSVGAIPVAKEG